MHVIESRITGGFWERWQNVNSRSAIFHQWDQLEKTGCIDNFRILAEGITVARRGWFFADSDAYKWLEAAYRVLALAPDPELSKLADGFMDLIEKAQDPDGYLYTFNQIHFPGTRWVNLQIEHELYCHGHLIEACIAGYYATGQDQVLAVGRKAADRILADFKGKGPQFTAGHEEIEIALLCLFEVTRDASYLELAGQLLDRRGKAACFGLNLLKQSISNSRRVKSAQKRALAFEQSQTTHSLPPANAAQRPPLIGLRFLINTLSGKFMQQHCPLPDQTVPVGHAVRFAYLQTAAAMYERLTGGSTYRGSLSQSWEHMVDRRMYITGGIGSLPEIEGFGRDYELDPAIAYAETCAALGCLFWNREMTKLTHDARYSDLYEWQLFNAALVGMGLDGTSYLYNNPLETNGTIERRDWYQVPCCPSNLSRTWVGLQADILDLDGDTLYIQQYFSSQHQLTLDDGEISLVIDSGLPWEGQVNIHFLATPNQPFDLKFRKPSWAGDTTLRLNGEVIQSIKHEPSGRLTPQDAGWLVVRRTWVAGDQLTLEFDLPVRLMRAHPKVKYVQGRVALARGPLVYCLESIDNPGVDIFSTVLDIDSIECEASDMLGGMILIKVVSMEGAPLTFIPYHLWGNCGRSAMCVFIHLSN